MLMLEKGKKKEEGDIWEEKEKSGVFEKSWVETL